MTLIILMKNNSYNESSILLDRALEIIPLGSQTFSKSYIQYPRGISPHFIDRGQGCYVWDVDGNKYIDFVNGLASVLLGYNDKEVTVAVQKQIENGVTFSLPHKLEVIVAESLVNMIPCAEMVRFGKNGTDATSAAIRLARAYTGRDHVAVCGYHGWQDWYIGTTTMNAGVPQAVRELSHAFKYNNISSLKSIFDDYPNQIAAVIMEPMNFQWPKDGFLEKVYDIASNNGALLIFDETITGGRFSRGGAQEFFNVIPDLATFGKGIANGFPLSAVVGKKKIMKHMEKVFFSGTFGGETSSLAAANIVLNRINNTDLVNSMSEKGKNLFDRIKALIHSHHVEHIFEITGHPTWTFLNIMDTETATLWQIKTLLIQEMFARGILFIGTHNLSESHTEKEFKVLLNVYDEVFPIIRDAVEKGIVDNSIKSEVLRPLFKVR
jgi:glutamate-1-semialdehyde 2,1-aminomutase